MSRSHRTSAEYLPEELDCVRALGRKNTARAAALIWSLKEAAVKATGTGFNCYDPLEVRVANPRPGGQGILFDVWAGNRSTYNFLKLPFYSV
ncbi:MAG: 4'-phosphopantetheinyl transferase superfamily protein [Desulfobacterales bacterium]